MGSSLIEPPMPISFEPDGDDVVWRQTFDHPAVYLDIFAIREISKSDELIRRFAQAIKTNGGTWMFAPATVAEFARFSDGKHSTQADELLRSVLPNIYLAHPEAAEAWGEGPFEEDVDRPMPAADERNMDFFSRKFARTEDAAQALQGLFAMLHEHRDKMSGVLDEVADRFIQTIEENRKDDAFRAAAKAARPDGIRSRVKIISGALMREWLLDLNSALSRNDALDFIHAVNAVNYCDLIMLDAAWERRVNALHQSIADSGIPMTVAKCFSLRQNGMERFLCALEC